MLNNESLAIKEEMPFKDINSAYVTNTNSIYNADHEQQIGHKTQVCSN